MREGAEMRTSPLGIKAAGLGAHNTGASIWDPNIRSRMGGALRREGEEVGRPS